MKIAVIDYGIGNVQSILSAFESQGVEAGLTRDKKVILSSDGVVLPGVGAFSHGMDCLHKYKLVEIIRKYTATKKPFLGVCLGMQMLFDESEEFGKSLGLGIIPGVVKKLPLKDDEYEKLPHVSWNELSNRGERSNWDNTILNQITEGSDVYFVHSYAVQPVNKSCILSVTEYSGFEFCSSVKKENIYGCQFHPEKSGAIGLNIIKNFIRICEENE